MNCPRCREANPPENIFCKNCGLRLKISCPNCEAMNFIDQERCSDCGFRLITYCPKCNTANNPANKNCINCGLSLLKECPKCGFMNSLDRTNCLKCNTNLNAIPVNPQAETSKLTEYAVLSAELLNLSAIKAKIKREDIVLKLINKFYQIVALAAKNAGESAWKLSEPLMAVEFKNSISTKISASSAIEAAQTILSEIDELNYQIQNKLKIKLKVKIGIALKNLERKDYFAKLERSTATAGDVILSAKVYNLSRDKFDFDKVGPVTVNNLQIPLYKLKKADEAEKIEIPPEIKQPEQVQAKEEKEAPQPETTEKPQVSHKEPEQVEEKAPKAESVREVSREEAFAFLTHILTDKRDKVVTTIYAPDGTGKTTLLSNVKQNLANENIVWVTSNCQPLSQIIPFGFFQDALKNLIGLPQIILNLEDSRKAVAHFIESNLGIKDKNVENTIHKLVFAQSNPDIYSIPANKKQTYQVLEEVIKSLNDKFRIAIFIENMEYIDKASLEFIIHLANTDINGEGIQIIATQGTEYSIDTFLPANEVSNQARLSLIPMNTEEINSIIQGMLNGQDILPVKLKSAIISNAKGSPFYVEQALWLLFQTGMLYNQDGTFVFNQEAENIELPDNLEDIIRHRLTQLDKISGDLLYILMNAAMFGQRFIPELLQKMVSMDEEHFSKAIQTLGSLGIFVNYDKFSLTFKHRIIWETVYKNGFITGHKTDYHYRALQVLKNFTLANSSILALHAELSERYQDSLNYWTQASQEAASVGDTQSFTTAQYRILNLVDKVEYSDPQDKERIKLNIYEQIGKINYRINPDEAVKYLSNAIVEREKQQNVVKIIDLTGYLSVACELKGNYAGVVECSDKALAYVDKEQMPLEYSLLNYSKLDALFNLGRVEECINTAQNDILPLINEALEKGKTLVGISYSELNSIMIQTQLVLAKALALQGNEHCLNIANQVYLSAKELGMTDIEAQAKIVEAQFNIIQGNIRSATDSVEYVKNLMPYIKNQNLINMYILFINLLMNTVEGKFSSIANLATSVLDLAEKCRNYNIQVITNLLIGKTFKESGNFKQAKQVYNDVITVSSENKYATGALLSWYLIAEAEAEAGSADNASEIAERAIEISQKPGINNYLFTMLLARLLGEIQITRGDFESAQIYTKQAYDIANVMHIQLFEAKTYLTFGKIYQESAAVSETNKEQNAIKAHDFLMKSLEIAQNLENEHLILQIEKELTNLSTFCQLSGIRI